MGILDRQRGHCGYGWAEFLVEVIDQVKADRMGPLGQCQGYSVAARPDCYVYGVDKHVNVAFVVRAGRAGTCCVGISARPRLDQGEVLDEEGQYEGGCYGRV